MTSPHNLYQKIKILENNRKPILYNATAENFYNPYGIRVVRKEFVYVTHDFEVESS